MQVGMHFMNPVPVMPLVEIIRGIATSDEARLLSTSLRHNRLVNAESNFLLTISKVHDSARFYVPPCSHQG